MLYETVMGWIAAQRNEGIAIGEKRGSYEKAVQTAHSFLAMGLIRPACGRGGGAVCRGDEIA